MLVHAGNFVAESGGEIFFVTEHDIDVRRDAAVHFLRLPFAAERFPERRAVVEIVGDDGAVALGGLHGFYGDIRSGGGKRAEDAAGVKPTGALLAEDLVPVDITFFQVGDGGVAAVVGAEGGAYTETAFGEIEAVARGAADAIVLDPADEGRVDAALIDQILEEAAYGIIGEGRDYGGIQA